MHITVYTILGCEYRYKLESWFVPFLNTIYIFKDLRDFTDVPTNTIKWNFALTSQLEANKNENTQEQYKQKKTIENLFTMSFNINIKHA